MIKAFKKYTCILSLAGIIFSSCFSLSATINYKKHIAKPFFIGFGIGVGLGATLTALYISKSAFAKEQKPFFFSGTMPSLEKVRHVMSALWHNYKAQSIS